jgi:hypothetical protein
MNSSFLPTVTQPYRGWSDSNLASETMKFQTALTGNATFAGTIPDMVTFSAGVQDFITQLGLAGSRDANAVAAKNTSRNNLIGLCITLGNSVNAIADGNLDDLISSAMPLRKKPSTVVLSVPSNFRITNGLNPGELVLRVKSMKGVRTYVYEYTQDPPTAASIWISKQGSTASNLVTGLESGKKYWFRITVIGSNGQSVLGDTLLSPFVQ